MDTYTKIDENTIEITKIVSEEIKMQHSLSFLKQQLITIQEQKNRDNTQRDLEIAEVQKLILEAEKMGIVEEIPSEIII